MFKSFPNWFGGEYFKEYKFVGMQSGNNWRERVYMEWIKCIVNLQNLTSFWGEWICLKKTHKFSVFGLQFGVIELF